MLPAPVLRDKHNRTTGGRGRRVKPKELQGLQRMHRRRPGLAWLTAPVGGREAGAAGPEPVRILEREEARAPSVALHSCSLDSDIVGRCVRQIPHHVPADSGIALEQPIKHVHRRRLSVIIGGHP